MKRVLLSGGLFLSVLLSATTVRAEELRGERADEMEILYAADEDGTVTEYEAQDGTVEVNRKTRAAAQDIKVVNFNCRGKELTYYKNVEDGSDGYLYGAFGADGAYIGETSGQVKFMISGVTGLVDPNQVQIVNYSDAKSISHYQVSGGRLLHKITTNLNSSGYGSTLDNGEAPSYLKENVKYYSYDGHYFYTDYAVMLSDYRADIHTNAVNPTKPYYNYYQFLSLRSDTLYSSVQLNQMINAQSQVASNENSKMRNIGSILTSNQKKYGVNALIVAGIAANESAWGTSNICQTKNNLFGLNARDNATGNAKVFYSVESCIWDFMENWMSEEYLNPNNWKYCGSYLGNKQSGMNVRYASDPYWGEKAANHIYTLDKRGGSADAGYYSLGVKNQVIQVNVRQNATTKSEILYKTPKVSEYVVLIRDTTPEQNFYQIQSDGVLNSQRTEIVKDVGVYDMIYMYAYISKDYVKIVHEGHKGFRDVKENEWYYDVVQSVAEQGLMTGYNSSYFGPTDALERAEFAMIVWRIEGSPKLTYEKVLKDVPNGTWFTDPVVWAVKKGIITGYTDTNTFKPSQEITRQEMATMLYRLAKWKGLKTDKKASLDSYADAYKVADFAEEAMQWAVGTGIIKGQNNGDHLDPMGTASRAACATMIQRFMTAYGL